MENSHEDQEALMFHHSYPCTYYVQSPSTLSHANSAADVRNSTINNPDDHDQSANFHLIHSPSRSESTFLNKNPEVSRFTLSHYSSSRGSTNSFLHDKKIIGVDEKGGVNRLIIIDHGIGDIHDDDDEEADEFYFYGTKNKGGWWWRYCSFRSSNSCAWISLQICWRLVLSLGVALLVFYLASKPPPPNVSIKMAGVRQFGLGEGVDASGVSTKILTCNCSIHLRIDNKSKLFGLHVHSPTIDMSFARLPFAMSRGPKLYAPSSETSLFELYVGTRNKPMYGAGRSMQDSLESGMGLPLVIRLKLSSNFRVVWNLIKPRFHHQAECLLVLHRKYDKKHRTQKYDSTCRITS